MSNKIRISLSEEASQALLEFMDKMNIESPTHCANVILLNLSKINQRSPCEDYNETGTTIEGKRG